MKTELKKQRLEIFLEILSSVSVTECTGDDMHWTNVFMDDATEGSDTLTDAIELGLVDIYTTNSKTLCQLTKIGEDRVIEIKASR